MKKLIFLLAVAAAAAAAVGFWRRKDASELWDSTRDTVTSWGEPGSYQGRGGRGYGRRSGWTVPRQPRKPARLPRRPRTSAE